MQPSTITLTLADSSGNPVAITTNYSDATNTITAWPQVFLAYSTTYNVTVSGATDAAGNTMASPFTWSFTTASATAVDNTDGYQCQSGLQWLECGCLDSDRCQLQ